MVESAPDHRIAFVLQQIETIVASEGGTLELISAEAGRLVVRYTPGINEDCPECVPTHEQVRQFLSASLQVHAPDVDRVEVN